MVTLCSLCTVWPQSCTLADPDQRRHRGGKLDWLVRLVFPAPSLTLANPRASQAAEHFFFFFLSASGVANSHSWCVLLSCYFSDRSFQIQNPPPQDLFLDHSQFLVIFSGPEFLRCYYPDSAAHFALST